MPVIHLHDQTHQLTRGQTRLGSGPLADVHVSDDASLAVQAVVEVGPDDQAVIRRARETASVKVNGLALGAEPTPLLHGDKIEIGGQELRFSDDRKAGATQFVSARESATVAARRPAGARATTGTGGRLVSLVDGKEYAVPEQGLVVGRDAGSDVVVAQSDVSRRHATIASDEDGYVLTDLSTNGVFVNGDRVHGTRVLARADVIRVGTEEFRFYADVAPVLPPFAPHAARPTAKPAASGTESAPAPAAAASVEPQAAAQPPADAGDTEDSVAAAPPPASPETASPLPASPAPSSEPPTVPAMAPLSGDAARLAASAMRPPLASFEVLNEGPRKGQRLEVRDALTHIGRGPHNEIVLPEDSVSDSHAKLQLRADGWYIVDMGSTNGTYVGGTRIAGERRLDGSPDVRFGGVKVRFHPAEGVADADAGTRRVPRFPEPSPPVKLVVPVWVWVVIALVLVVGAVFLLKG